jgi:hypothetical protein
MDAGLSEQRSGVLLGNYGEEIALLMELTMNAKE